jgi:mono/diheme cytochrome c family protein
LYSRAEQPVRIIPTQKKLRAGYPYETGGNMMSRGWPLLAVLGGCLSRDLRVAAVLELQGDPASGEELFAEHCSTCHGEGGIIIDEHSEDQVAEQILYGGTESVYTYMPAFMTMLSDQEIADLVAFVMDRST